jgi:hypothetical protein
MGYQVTGGRVTQYPRKEKWAVIISMIEIIYFSGDSLSNGVSKNIIILYSPACVSEWSRLLVIAFKSELQSVRVFGLEGHCNS